VPSQSKTFEKSEMSKVNISRRQPRNGIAEHPVSTTRGYQLADPKFGADKHHAEYAVFVRTLEEAADLIERENYSIWMTQPGKRASLISRQSLIISRK